MVIVLQCDNWKYVFFCFMLNYFTIIIRWIDGTPTEFTKWGPGDPSDQGGTKLCASFQIKDGKHVC